MLYIKNSVGKYNEAKDAEIISGARRVLRSSALRRGAIIKDAEDAVYILKIYLHEDTEVFGCLFLDNERHVLEFAEMSRGTVDKAPVYPRELVKKALFLGATAIILCHNHPAGNPCPSDADTLVTRQIKLACDLFSIQVLDHVIVADDKHFSFQEKGLI